ncbi:DUF6756 family protein [Piscinibacter gummiphilus]|uniref:DUF6756 family protein n=1 Tax=Piscinibacter gummiphilus TaxID=946333 RepID=A0ABZ0CPK7_9BURK|nr:DUF6756 family protein [Piscinibacter gummiphilus]WOB06925.1 DUF6756 family protein [Piscinibacter gummiphilus]
MHPTLRDTLNEVAGVLALDAKRFRLLRPHEYEPILEAITEQFLNVGTKGLNYYRWWENFKGSTASFHAADAYKLLPKLLPHNQALWFIVEDSSKKAAPFWVYEADAEAINQVLAESHQFEYYIVSKKQDWLLCETHHEVLVAVGEPMIRALSNAKTERSG